MGRQYVCIRVFQLLRPRCTRLLTTNVLRQVLPCCGTRICVAVCMYVCMYVCMFCLSWARLRSFAQVNGLFVTDLFRSALTIYAGMYVCTNECIIARHDACVAQSLMLDVDNENAAAAAAIAEVLEFSCEAALCFKSPVDKESKIILEKFHIVTWLHACTCTWTYNSWGKRRKRSRSWDFNYRSETSQIALL